MTYNELKNEIMNNPTIHDSLKKAIEIFDITDCLDSYYDCKILIDLMRVRLNERNSFRKYFCRL